MNGMSQPDWIKQETEKLVRAWDRHEAPMLRDYLVADVEDPRLNVQSILTRHFLAEALFGGRWAWLQEQELRFAVVANWLQSLFQAGVTAEERAVILYTLKQGGDDAEGREIPRFLLEFFATLPAEVEGMTIPNYFIAALETSEGQLPQAVLNTFQGLWQRALARKRPGKISVVEPACGSANDYRFAAAYGLGRLLDYHGFDLCEKNVANARALFPRVRFTVGNALQIEAPDRAYDCAVVHDLFEHLSAAGLAQAAGELCRVTRHAMCLGFFNMGEASEHQIVPVDDYHWNKLSVEQMRALLAQHGFACQVIHIATFLISQYGCDRTHNPHAYTFLAWRESPAGA
jgi:SAM-dependent methyltransferase